MLNWPSMVRAAVMVFVGSADAHGKDKVIQPSLGIWVEAKRFSRFKMSLTIKSDRFGQTKLEMRWCWCDCLGACGCPGRPVVLDNLPTEAGV